MGMPALHCNLKVLPLLLLQLSVYTDLNFKIYPHFSCVVNSALIKLHNLKKYKVVTISLIPVLILLCVDHWRDRMPWLSFCKK